MWTLIQLMTECSFHDFRKNLTASEFGEWYRPVNLVVLDEFDSPMTSKSQIFIGTIFKLVVYITNTEGNAIISVSHSWCMSVWKECIYFLKYWIPYICSTNHNQGNY